MKKQILSVLLALLMITEVMSAFTFISSASDSGKTVLSVQHGTVEFDLTNINAGDIITVKVCPDDGYVVNTNNLGGADPGVFAGNNTFTYHWYSNEQLIADFALVRGCAVYFDSTDAPNKWDNEYSRIVCISEDESLSCYYMLKTTGNAWYATVPDDTYLIYFQNFIIGQPEEYLDGGYQKTHSFEPEADKTYSCGSNLCTDTDSNHRCDVCDDYMPTLCTDTNNDHHCEVCDEHISILCSDTDTDHYCDVCEVWLYDCIDNNGIFKCSVCGEWMFPDPDTMNTVAEAGDSQITVTWIALSDVENVYDNVTYSVNITDEDGNTDTYTSYNRNGNDCLAVIKDLTNDMTYEVEIEVTCADWDDYSISYGVEVTPYSATATVPKAPTEVTAVAGVNQIVVSWTPPKNNGGAKIKNYIIEYIPKGSQDGNGGGTYAVDGDVTSVTITDLENYVEYEIMVCAENAVGLSNYSKSVFATPCKLVKYDLEIRGIQVTNINAQDILGDGTVSYDADTNTLTLTDATLKWDYADRSMIFCGNNLKSLTIKGVDTPAAGNNSMESKSTVISGNNTDIILEGIFGNISANDMYDIFGKSITVAENCTIEKIGGTSGIAVYGENSVAISGTVGEIKADGSGIMSDGDVSVGGSVGKIVGNNNYAILSRGNITISGKTEKIIGGTYGIYTDGKFTVKSPVEISGNVAIAANGGINSKNVIVSQPYDYVICKVEVDKNKYYSCIGTEDTKKNFTPAKTVKYVPGYTVTYKADDTVIDTQAIEKGKNTTAPQIPQKDGFVGKWDNNGKNITKDTVITAVYTKLTGIVPNEIKPEDKDELENAKKKLEDMLDDDGYTEADKKKIKAAIEEINNALEVIKNSETEQKPNDKQPENTAKNEDTPQTDDNLLPQTGDNSNLWLWFTLMFVSGSGIIAVIKIRKSVK